MFPDPTALDHGKFPRYNNTSGFYEMEHVGYFDVRHGHPDALFNGTTADEDTVAIVNTVALAEAAGGGIVLLPAGVAMLHGDYLILPSNVRLKGHGESTIVRKASAGTMIVTEGYTPTPATIGGVHGWGLEDLILDGNLLSGDGVRSYGTGHYINNVAIVRNLGFGWVSRYVMNNDGLGIGPMDTGVNGHVGILKFNDNRSGNMDFDGPHDSTFGIVTAALHSINAEGATVSRGTVPWNIRIGPKGGSQYGVLHPWGDGVELAIKIEGAATAVSDLYAEGGTVRQVQIVENTTNVRLRGWVQSHPQGAETPKGVDLGGLLCKLDLVAVNCYGGGVDFGTEPTGAVNDLQIAAFESPLVGTPDISDQVKYVGAPHTGQLAVAASAGYETVGIWSGKVGFFGEPPVVRPTVSGSRGGNAALASLLTALDNLGLIIDSSS